MHLVFLEIFAEAYTDSITVHVNRELLQDVPL